MNKNILVRFSSNGARIEVNPDNFDLIQEDKISIFKNPDLTKVIELHLAPHKWAVEDGKIVPAKEHIVIQREAELTNSPLPKIKYNYVKNRTKIIILSILIISSLALYFSKKYDITINITPKEFSHE